MPSGAGALSQRLFHSQYLQALLDLFAAECRMGAMASGASEAQCEAYAAYGMQLGIAFQEQDDLLGVWGLSAETGKPDAADPMTRE